MSQVPAEQLIEQLNADNRESRLSALKELMALYDSGTLKKPVPTENVNNHIHTIYSFSPYSPTKAAYMAWINGLTTAGIMDHDTISGAEEFIEAGRIIGIATTIGFECRVDMSNTPFKGRRINNPDQDSVAYLAMHGVPHQSIPEVSAFLAPLREKRNLRNRRMVDNLNHLLGPWDVQIDFDRDVVPISQSAGGGSITERHILFAVANKLIARFGRGAALVSFLKDEMKMPVSSKNEQHLLDAGNPYYAYDLLGVLKSDMVEKFYIPATDECPDVRAFIDLANRIGGISAYAYLGDVGNSVTGDKKTQKFEDDYLDELVDELARLGFRAVTYMPTRNTSEQLARLIRLCESHSLFQISGEDINSPRQSFICEALQNPQYRHLIDATWALIGHEKAATEDLSRGMFSAQTIAAYPKLQDRIPVFVKIGKA